jgi:DNA-binding transcriptional LysR family regulator
MLSPQWLRTFAAVVEQGSFTRCAEYLDLTQAAVSQHVQKLEERLGPLLIRRPRQLELTPAGRALLDYCREVNAADQRLEKRLSEQDDTHGEIGFICCGFHAIRPPSPLSSGQAFQGHLATCSTAIRPGSRSAATQGWHC